MVEAERFHTGGGRHGRARLDDGKHLRRQGMDAAAGRDRSLFNGLLNPAVDLAYRQGLVSEGE